MNSTRDGLVGHTNRARWGAGTSLMVLVLGIPPLHAQGGMRGKVVDSEGVRLPGVEVVLPEVGRREVTDSSGLYRITIVRKGRFEVLFRRVGYQPLRLLVSFTGDSGDAVVNVELSPEAVVLPEVEAKARGPEEVPVKLREWARRREFNVGGKFWDDSLLRTQEHRQLPEVLHTVPGVRIIRASGGRYLAIGGGRGSNAVRRGMDRSIPPACYVEVYIDGARLSSAGVPVNLDNIPVQQIAAMELYRSASEMPVEFNSPGASCGVLAIWTRVGSEK